MAQPPPEPPKPVPAGGTHSLTFIQGGSTLSSGDRHRIWSRDARSGGTIDRLDNNFWSDDRRGLTIPTEVLELMSIPLAAALLQGTFDQALELGQSHVSRRLLSVSGGGWFGFGWRSRLDEIIFVNLANIILVCLFVVDNRSLDELDTALLLLPGRALRLERRSRFQRHGRLRLPRDNDLHININTYSCLRRVGGGRGRSRCRRSEHGRAAQTRQLSFAYKAEQWLTGVTALTLNGGDRNGLFSFSEREREIPE